MEDMDYGQGKESFAISYNGKEIWCEQLDSLGKHTNMLMDKLSKDIKTIADPASASSIIMTFYDTEIDKSLLMYIFKQISKCDKKIKKIAVLGLPRKLTNEVPSISITSDYPIKCFSDLNKAKEWVM